MLSTELPLKVQPLFPIRTVEIQLKKLSDETAFSFI
jgi:hypothetical protein